MDPGDYFDDLASFYDAVHDQQGDDAAFYRGLASEANGPVLEVGCGTGRIYLELLRAGVDADGIDVSSDSLDVLRETAAEEGLEPTVREGEMTTFEPEREYALVIVPFRTFLYLHAIDDQLAAFDRFHDALAPDGRLALNAFVPSFELICDQYGEWIEHEITLDGDAYIYRTISEIDDEVKQLARVRTEVTDDDGSRVAESGHRLKLLSKSEFELLFRCSPFSSWEGYGGFEYEPLEAPSREMVWIAEP